MIRTTGENFNKSMRYGWHVPEMFDYLTWNYPIKNMKHEKIETTNEKIKLIGYLILCEINFCNLKNEHFVKNSPKS